MIYPNEYPDPTYSVTAIAELIPLSSQWGIHDAAKVFFDYNGLALITDGCSEEGTKKCSTACSDVNKIVASPSNVQNRLAYPIIQHHMSIVYWKCNTGRKQRCSDIHHRRDSNEYFLLVGGCISG